MSIGSAHIDRPAATSLPGCGSVAPVSRSFGLPDEIGDLIGARSRISDLSRGENIIIGLNARWLKAVASRLAVNDAEDDLAPLPAALG